MKALDSEIKRTTCIGGEYSCRFEYSFLVVKCLFSC